MRSVRIVAIINVLDLANVDDLNGSRPHRNDVLSEPENTVLNEINQMRWNDLIDKVDVVSEWTVAHSEISRSFTAQYIDYHNFLKEIKNN
jgi:hypothetical protein